jgi:predicted SAM-dependent methyltransferase
LTRLAARRGIVLTITRSSREPPPLPPGLVCLNVGAGRRPIPGFVSLDIPSARYHEDEHDFETYDIRRDALPYADGSVDLIYCSHVIEHIEDVHAFRFLREAARVLRPGGVLRISTPDAHFLWEVSSFPNTYWWWR